MPQTTDSQTEQRSQDLASTAPVGLFSGDAFAVHTPRAASDDVMLFSQGSVSPFSGASFPPLLPKQSFPLETDSMKNSSQKKQKNEAEETAVTELEVREIQTAAEVVETIWGEPVGGDLRGEAEGGAEWNEGPIHTTVEEARLEARGDASYAREQQPNKVRNFRHLFPVDDLGRSSKIDNECQRASDDDLNCRI